METIVNTVYEFIVNNNLIVPGDRVLVSVSAGKDSMFLLHVISELRGAMGIEAGDRVEAIVARLGARLGARLAV